MQQHACGHSECKLSSLPVHSQVLYRRTRLTKTGGTDFMISVLILWRSVPEDQDSRWGADHPHSDLNTPRSMSKSTRAATGQHHSTAVGRRRESLRNKPHSFQNRVFKLIRVTHPADAVERRDGTETRPEPPEACCFARSGRHVQVRALHHLLHEGLNYRPGLPLVFAPTSLHRFRAAAVEVLTGRRRGSVGT